MKDGLEKLRKEIDEIDRNLLKIISRRFSVCRKAGIVKRAEKMKIRDARREKALESLYEKRAKELSLNPLFAKKLFKIIISESKRIQSKI